MKKFVIAISMVVCLFAAAAVQADLCTEPVSTETGDVRGRAVKGSSACEWLGIPFAAAPVGELRWKAPAPAHAWSGVREATKYGDRCFQQDTMKMVESLNPKPTGKLSEDCLYLNVWRPAKSGSFPVMVWIHGGGYNGGTGASGFYRGDRLADAGDVVVVTINYRLGVFGFMAHQKAREEDPNGAVGGYGSLDQVASLQWVHDNIANFGGDPDNVTIFGESAGGWSVCTMVATPLNQGLFHRAIIESGGCISSWSLERGYDQACDIAADLGCGRHDLECLRDVPAARLAKSSVKTVGANFAFYPNHDGYLLTDTPLAMIREGNYNRVSLMAGSNLNEADALTYMFPKLNGVDESNYEQVRVKSVPLNPDEARRLVELYPLSDFEGKAKKAYGQILTDSVLSCPTYEGAQAAAANGTEVYYYRFDYDGYRFGSLIGSVHAMEIPFIFDSMDRSPTNLLYDFGNMSEAKALKNVVQPYWINFAKTGDPNGPGLPKWGPFTDADPQRMIINVHSAASPADNVDKCEFWDAYNQNHDPTVFNLGKY